MHSSDSWLFKAFAGIPVVSQENWQFADEAVRDLWKSRKVVSVNLYSLRLIAFLLSLAAFDEVQIFISVHTDDKTVTS